MSQKVGEIFYEVTLETAGMLAQLDDVSDVAKRISENLQKIGSTASDMGIAAKKGMASAAGGAKDAASAMQTAGSSAKEAGTKLADTAAKAGSASRELTKIKDAADGGASGMRNLSGASSTLSTKLTAISAASASFIAGIYVLQKINDVSRALYDASVAAERLKIGLDYATGGSGSRELAYVTDLSNKLGLSLQSTASAYMGFAAAARGTALEGAATRSIFEAVSKASAVMGLSADQSSGALLALQQMISKGTVQSEELRGQLGERLPGAFQIAARSMGVTTAELGNLLEQGKVLTYDFLPKFAAQLEKEIGGAADQAADRLGAALARMEGAWFRFKQTVGDSGISKAMDAEYAALTRELTALSDAMERTRNAGGSMGAELATGLGVAAGRIGFSTLNLLANTLNGTINLLTGSAFDLNTNMALLPDAFKTSAQQAVAMAQDLQRAEAEMAALRAQSDRQGSNIYIKSEIAALSQYIAKLKEAQGAKADLTGVDPRHIDPAQTRGASYGRWDEEQAKAAAGLTKARMKAQGVNKEYFETLQVYQNGLKTGLMSEKEYVAAVSELAKKTYEGSTTGKDANKKPVTPKKTADQKFDDAGYLAGLETAAVDAWAKVGVVEEEAKRKNDKLLAEKKISQETHSKAVTLIIADATRERAKIETEAGKKRAEELEKLTQTLAETAIEATTNELAKIDAIRQENHRRADAAVKAGVITFAQGEADKAKAALTAQQAIRDQVMSINPMAKLTEEYEQKLALVQYYEQQMAQAGITANTFAEEKRAELSRQFQLQRQALLESEFAMQSAGNQFLMDSLNSLSSTATSSIVGLIQGTMTAGDAMRALGNVVLSEAVGALVQIGVQYIKNALIGAAAEKGMMAVKAANAAVYTAAITAQVGVTASLAAAAAFASTAAIPIVGPGLAPAAAAAAASIAGALGAPAIAAAPVAGMRQYGGPASSGNLYRVNEKGAPEMFTAGNGSQYMLPTQSGRVTAADKVGGGSVQWTIIVNNTAGGTTASASVDDQSKTVNIAIAQVAAQIRENSGAVWSALRGASNVQSRMG